MDRVHEAYAPSYRRLVAQLARTRLTSTQDSGQTIQPTLSASRSAIG